MSVEKHEETETLFQLQKRFMKNKRFTTTKILAATICGSILPEFLPSTNNKFKTMDFVQKSSKFFHIKSYF